MSESEQEQVPYRVLARKYRPQNFDDLIGQDALVRTLKNAIESGRIAHAFMLTGIRGVGKTTTARIIAKALNYTGADGTAGPTTGVTDDCETCKAITEDRHPDVMEMDAASRTGIDDIREILDGVRYAPTSARYKIYIIDEVHMLSKAAFNALLKTLEEPPEHVKFIFATTEIRKVPVTVLSRCQRFDLRRIDADVLADYYGQIAGREKTETESAALNLIARAADGSVRDGLSLLDQSIALGEGKVTETQVKEMLGMADQALITDLLEYVLKGQPAESLAIMNDLYQKGADPIVIIQDMLSLIHEMTKHRALPANKNTQVTGEEERVQNLADMLSMPTLSRAWQIILKGLAEVNTAPNAQKAAEMVVLRLTYAADMPDPADLLKKIEKAGSASTSAMSMQAAANAPTPSGATLQSDVTQPDQGTGSGSQGQTMMAATPALEIQSEENTDHPIAIKTVRDVVTVLEKNGDMILATQVRMFVHPIKIAEGLIEFRPADDAPERLAPELSRAMKAITGNRWVITVSPDIGEATLAQQADEQEDALRNHILEQPLVQNIIKFFPDAQLKEITKK